MYYNLDKMINDVFAVPHIRWSTLEKNLVDEFTTEKDGSTKIIVYVPGFAKEDFNLQVIDSELRLTTKDENKKLKRSWKLSDSADTKNISAECKNGILTINVPLKAKTDKSRTVEIK
jgi:HSP20 family molecular chaperone IbpA